MTSETVEDLTDRYGPRYKLLVTLTGMSAAFTMVLSGTIVNVAIPDVMGTFGVSQNLAQFTSTAYIATMTASQLLNAWFIGMFGPRLSFSIVLCVFALGSLVCAYSPTLDLIILGRIMQGFASGIIQPLVLVTIIRVFPKERRGLAMSVSSMGLVLALGCGPVVGGLLIDAAGWRYIFFIPLPLVAFALVLGSFFMPEVDAEGKRRQGFDWWGYALLCVSIFCLMSGIANGQRLGWESSEILLYFSIGALSTLAFVLSQLREGSSLLDVSLFADIRFAAAALVAVIYGIGNFAMNYAVPVFGQLVQGLSPTVAGTLLLPAALAVLFALPFTGWIIDHFRTEVPLLSGCFLFMSGAWLLTGSDVNTSFLFIALSAVVARMGMALMTPGIMTSALKAVPEERLNAGSGTINFCRQLGGAFGINSLVAFIERRTEFHAEAFGATQRPDNATTVELVERTRSLIAESGLPDAVSQLLALHHLRDMVGAQADTRAFQDGFYMIAAVFFIAMFPAWWMGRQHQRH